MILSLKSLENQVDNSGCLEQRRALRDREFLLDPLDLRLDVVQFELPLVGSLEMYSDTHKCRFYGLLLTRVGEQQGPVIRLP